ncbi:MAG: hypothetical protein ACK44H_08335 [Candidatus Kryptonium sp.]
MFRSIVLLIGLSILLLACTGGEKLPSLKEYFKSDEAVIKTGGIKLISIQTSVYV